MKCFGTRSQSELWLARVSEPECYVICLCSGLFSSEDGFVVWKVQKESNIFTVKESCKTAVSGLISSHSQILRPERTIMSPSATSYIAQAKQFHSVTHILSLLMWRLISTTLNIMMSRLAPTGIEQSPCLALLVFKDSLSRFTTYLISKVVSWPCTGPAFLSNACLGSCLSLVPKPLSGLQFLLSLVSYFSLVY